MNVLLRSLVLLLFVNPVPVPVSAQSLSPAPRPGLWLIESKTLINGENIMIAMQAAQRQMLESLPPEYRAAVEAAMGQMDEVDRNRQCITAEDIAIITDPQAYLRRIHDEMPDCRFEILRSDRSTLRLKGHCDGADGFSGDLEGELQIISDRQMRSVFTGVGRYLVDVELPGIELPEDGTVELRMEESSSWISADCDDEMSP